MIKLLGAKKASVVVDGLDSELCTTGRSVSGCDRPAGCAVIGANIGVHVQSPQGAVTYNLATLLPKLGGVALTRGDEDQMLSPAAVAALDRAEAQLLHDTGELGVQGETESAS